MYKNSFLSVSLVLLVFLAGCGDHSSSETTETTGSTDSAVAAKPQAEIDEEKIADYLKTNGIENAQSTESGLYYVIDSPGEGEHPTVNSTVLMHYKGMTLKGDIFDSSYDSGEPLNYPLRDLIRGWQEGVPLLGRGGKATLYIPSTLAYGPRRRSDLIGPNEVLIFDVELLDFQ
ncbi:MAG: FKBP-type peptidyl-prolyl cis-trans isomerase [Bacteroidia bacterium]